ncbi:hypothetical protein OQA88_9990 [Cercophora sp. LCS_1]
MDVRTVLIKSSTKDLEASQQPLTNHHPEGWGESSRQPADQGDSNEKQGAHNETETLVVFHNTSHPMTCDYDMEKIRHWQQKYKLQEKFEYTKRYIQPSRQNIPRKSMTKVQQHFLVDEVKVLDVGRTYEPQHCPEPIMVLVSRSSFPAAANASDFMFGVSTTYKRFTDPAINMIKEWAYWLTDGKGNSNGGKLILMLLDASFEELEDASDQLKDVGIDVDVYRSDPSMIMAVRYLTLVPTMYDHPDRKGKRWLVTCDDDTFFPSLHGLIEKLEEYDHSIPMYIGTFSEDVNNIARHGPQAFGGAGVFLSLPMAEMITESYDACKTEEKIREANSGWGPQGDIILRRCIEDNSETKLTLLNDLWQLDMYGDPSGFYESGIKPLSVHHYRGGPWHIAHPSYYTQVAHQCGEDCILQRFQTEDNFIIANGFSVAHYPQGIDFDVHQFERTFAPAPEDKGWNYDFIMGPQRPSLAKTGRKLSWDLQDASTSEDGSVSQLYVRKHDDWRWKNEDGSPMSDMDGIVELVWLPARE